MLKVEDLGFCEFSYDGEKEQFKDLIVQSITEGYKRNVGFFGFELKFKVFFYYTREEFSKNWIPPEYALENKWLSAYAIKTLKNQLFFLSPTVLEELSNNKLDRFQKTTGHEISHLFIREIQSNDLPFVFKEGLPYAINSQTNENWVIELIEKQGALLFGADFEFTSDFDSHVTLFYQQSGSMIKWLLEKKGKKKLIEFIKGNDSSITAAFERIFSLSKEEFFESWLKDFKEKSF
ncbi:MAG: hypothetical protein Q7R70_04920 [Candidatus Diapherotrites archaeon]|nr:hypothetical protein [Candidatus Diapherotrites archaeon]